MILTPDELTGKALDWAYELILDPDARYIRVIEGRIQFHITDTDAEFGGSGWYAYRRKFADTNEDAARKLVAEKVGAFVIVPTDLVSPRWYHHEHEAYRHPTW